MIDKRNWMLLAVVILVHGCVSLSEIHKAATTPESEAKISLKCNKNADFYVDGKHVGTGRMLEVEVEPNIPHTIVAKPPGYISKEEYIEPPYDSRHPYSFTYMIGDKEDAE